MNAYASDYRTTAMCNNSIANINMHACNHTVPWFPKNISELDRNANKVLEAGGELKSDHPVCSY